MADGKLLTQVMGRVAASFSLAVKRGDIAGVEHKERFGRIDGVNVAHPPVDVWNGGGEYSGHPLGAAEELEISSGEAADTAVGTGARTVRIIGALGANKEIIEDVVVTLNGTGWVDVNPGQVYSRCSKAEVITAGTGGENAGAITIRHKVTTANVFAVMPVGKCSTAIMADTVPAGFTLFTKRWHIAMSRASGAAGSANISIRAREDRADAPFVALRDPEITQGDHYESSDDEYIELAEKTDFKVAVDSVSDNGTQVSGEYTGYLIANE